MAANRYYRQKELAEIGMEGFALIDEFYGGGRKGKIFHNYPYATTYKVTSGSYRPPPRPAAANSVIAVDIFTAGSGGGVSGKVQNSCSYRYPPPASLVCYAPVVAATAETITVVRGYEKGGQFSDGAI